ncbi:hypothetical protein GE115_15575 [Agromyces sp. CFH 90414]|uniref:DUF4190 domain-containing protein n=1 Tax=Agromyces agglutinans TaxID=2662258 RepID=A0A6I2F715_9MICO|nr:DUF4190 domain-containing protein [Agromyces agglutinans]MRG61275.1 hypothetical protein [Agromyces agglutinans]
MSDAREGVPPAGGAPDPSHDAAAPGAPAAPAPETTPEGSSPGGAISDGTAPGGAISDGTAPDGAPLDPLTHDPLAADPLAPYRPGGPTFQADPAIREFDEPLDTGRLQRLPTGQLLIVHRAAAPAPAVSFDDEDEETQRRVYSWVGAVVGSLGALASLFVGWMLPLSIAAIVFGVLGLRREEHGRTLAFTAIGTGITGLVFSAVWIGYYAIVYGAIPA